MKKNWIPTNRIDPQGHLTPQYEETLKRSVVEDLTRIADATEKLVMSLNNIHDELEELCSVMKDRL